MKAPYFVEILARSGDVRRRVKLDSLPISLGRGYDNDVILDDVHAAVHHAIIEQMDDNSLAIRDLGSRNGTIHKGRRITSMQADGDVIFRLGHTNIRVRSSDFPVTEELADTSAHGWEGRLPALVGMTLVSVLALLSSWLSDTQKFETTKYLLAVAVMLGSVTVWSGIWALANRLFGGQPRFGRHIFIAGCGMVTMEVWSAISAVTAYAFSLSALTRYGNHVLMTIAVGMIFFHLRTINPGHTKRFLTIGIIMTLVSSGLMLVSSYQNNGRLTKELYMYELLPPSLRISANKSVDQFFNDAQKLQVKLDAERNKLVSSEWYDTEDKD